MANEIFGIDYGGPSCAIVHQDRLVLAGGGAVPDVVAASKTGNWLDFALEDEIVGGRSVPTEASGFWFQQTTARGNRFHAMLQQQGLLLFGDVGESVIPAGPFTAAQAEVRENTWLGSDTGRTPVIAGNLVIFLQKDGEDCRAIVWNEQQLKYVARSTLVLSGSVFDNARDMTYQPSSGRQGDTIYVIDQDGSVAVMLLRVAGDESGTGLFAWSRWTTEGRVIGATAPLGRAVFIVERGVGDARQVALETLAEPGERFDCQVDMPHGGMLPEWMEGLTHETLGARLIGDECDTEVDYPFHVTGRVPIDSRTDTQIDWLETIRIGLSYERTLETTQFVKRTQTGTSGRVRPARIIDAAVDFVLPQEPGDVPRPAEWEDLRALTFTIVPYSRRGRRRRLAGKPPRTASGRIYSVRYPCRLGWRDRIAIELKSDRHVEIAGVAYRAAA